MMGLSLATVLAGVGASLRGLGGRGAVIVPMVNGASAWVRGATGQAYAPPTRHDPNRGRLVQAVGECCLVLDGDQLKPGTNFH